MSHSRLLRALVRRELDAMCVVLLAIASACAAAAACQVHGPGAGGPMLPVMGQLIRRFDLTVLAVMMMFLTLRCAARIEADHADGWLPPFLAAGGSRCVYGAAFTLSAMVAPAMIFATTAATFAAVVTILTGSSELLRILPRTIGAGLLVLGTYSVCTVAVGILLRRASAAVVVVGLLVVFPLFLLVRHALSDGAPPLWAMGLQLLSPLLFLPQDGGNVVRALGYILAGWALVVVVSHRYTGRMP